MKVCIAEKPSVAREIASVLGATRKCNGYFEGNGYQVTWTFGHLCTLKEPQDYSADWKRWSLDCLPMVPPRFGIKLIPGNATYEQHYGHLTDMIKNTRNNFGVPDLPFVAGDFVQHKGLLGGRVFTVRVRPLKNR